MQRRILIASSTLAMESIAAALEAIALESGGDIELRRIASVPDVWPDDFVPDAVLFDVSAGIPDCTRACLASDKDLLLLGFELESHQVLLLSGVPANLSTMADLAEILWPAAGIQAVHGNGDQPD